MRITFTQAELNTMITNHLVDTSAISSPEDINRITYRIEAASQEVTVTVDVED